MSSEERGADEESQGNGFWLKETRKDRIKASKSIVERNLLLLTCHGCCVPPASNPANRSRWYPYTRAVSHLAAVQVLSPHGRASL
jgi:hypothetical protein